MKTSRSTEKAGECDELGELQTDFEACGIVPINAITPLLRKAATASGVPNDW